MNWWTCPNNPPCPHGGVVHDIEEPGDPSPLCCVEGCHCGHAPDCQIRTKPPAGFPFPTFSCDCDMDSRAAAVHARRARALAALVRAAKATRAASSGGSGVFVKEKT